MSYLLLLVGVAVSLLALKDIGIRNLSEDELAELDAIECPQCRRNLETIKAVYGLWMGLKKLHERGANFVNHILLPHVKSGTNRIEHNPNKGAESHP